MPEIVTQFDEVAGYWYGEIVFTLKSGELRTLTTGYCFDETQAQKLAEDTLQDVRDKKIWRDWFEEVM